MLNAFSDLKSELPASTLPGIINNQLNQTPKPTSPLNFPPSKMPETSKQINQNAEKIKFKLTKIILKGNKIYSAQKLEMIYQKKIGKTISVADLQSIVQDITNYYRNNGYILSRAILPPQKIQNGVVTIQIIEGFISEINVIGTPWRSTDILKKFSKNILASRPLKINILEHYLRLENEIPGLKVKSVLEPSKKTVGASDLNLVANQNIFTGLINYNNFGTRYIGPQQLQANLATHSILLSGDSIRLVYSTTPAHPKQMKFYDASYMTFIGSKGLNMTLGKSYSLTHPAFTLQPVKIEGASTHYYLNVAYPLIRERSSSLTFDGEVNYLDSSVTSFHQLLYIDHLRTISFGGLYLFADRFNGSNSLDLNLTKGLSLAGGTTNRHSAFTSRFGATSIFTKATTTLSRQQPLFGRFSLYGQLNAQYSREPLLSSEQFNFGGPQLGRGFDPAELIGDKGIAGTIELRADFIFQTAFLNFIQPFLFYDQGVIWNIKPQINTKPKYSAASTGAGINFLLTQFINGKIFIGQPLTHDVSALEIIGRARRPRIFFSLTFSRF